MMPMESCYIRKLIGLTQIYKTTYIYTAMSWYTYLHISIFKCTRSLTIYKFNNCNYIIKYIANSFDKMETSNFNHCYFWFIYIKYNMCCLINCPAGKICWNNIKTTLCHDIENTLRNSWLWKFYQCCFPISFQAI